MPVPREHDRHHHRHVALLLALALAGCTAPGARDDALESASLEGAIALGDAFLLEGARLSVAPQDEPARGARGRPVALADPPEVARTELARDHWVLEATLRERAPGAAEGAHRVRLDWNGALAGELYLEGAPAAVPLAITLRYDVGPTLARSNVYAFEISRTP